MQTFLPYEQYDLSALVLDNKRLGNQRKECMQIVNILTVKREEAYGENKPKVKKEYIERTGTIVPWSQHPAVLMWKDHVYELLMYMKTMCREWARRGYTDALWKLQGSKSLATLKEYVPFDSCEKPWWLGDDRLHISHQSNLLKKKPEFYGKLFNIPADIPYWWPGDEVTCGSCTWSGSSRELIHASEIINDADEDYGADDFYCPKCKAWIDR